MTVRQISITEFKAHCTEEIREVEKGNVILQVTRHGKPVVTIGSAGSEHLHVGSKVGKGSLKPLLHRASKGKYLELLAEDRRGDPDGR